MINCGFLLENVRLVIIFKPESTYSTILSKDEKHIV